MTREPAFAMSANVHHPTVKSVFRLPADHAGVRLLAVNLGDPTGYSHVSLLVTDEQWRAIVRDTDAEVARVDAGEGLGTIRAAIRDESVSASEIFDLQTMAEHISADDVELREWAGIAEDAEKCTECGSWLDDTDLLTEHMFAAHPEAVAR